MSGRGVVEGVLPGGAGVGLICKNGTRLNEEMVALLLARPPMVPS